MYTGVIVKSSWCCSVASPVLVYSGGVIVNEYYQTIYIPTLKRVIGNFKWK